MRPRPTTRGDCEQTFGAAQNEQRSDDPSQEDVLDHRGRLSETPSETKMPAAKCRRNNSGRNLALAETCNCSRTSSSDTAAASGSTGSSGRVWLTKFGGFRSADRRRHGGSCEMVGPGW